MRLVCVCLFSAIWMIALTEGFPPPAGSYMDYQKKLYRYLLNDYDKAIRPAENSGQVLTVKVNLHLTSLDDLDAGRQLMSATGWLPQVWTDFQLTWNPSDYGGIREIEVPIILLWHPDITVENTNNYVAPSEHELALVSSNGTVFWAQGVGMQTKCQTDLSHFPFDSHTCNIDLASWAYSDNKVIFINELENETSCDQLSSNEWTVSGCSDSTHLLYYTVEEQNYTAFHILRYTFTLSRTRSFASHLFVAPSVALCLITPMVFLLPPGSQEKMTLGVGVLIADVLLLGELIKFAPGAYPTVPLIGKYFLSNIVMTSLSLMISALVLNMWGRSTSRINGPPKLIQVIALGYLAKWLCVTEDQFVDSLDDDFQPEQLTTSDAENLQSLPMETSNKNRLRQAQNYVRKIVKLQWRQLAILIDRIFFVMYLIVLLCLTFMFAQYM